MISRIIQAAGIPVLDLTHHFVEPMSTFHKRLVCFVWYFTGLKLLLKQLRSERLLWLLLPLGKNILRESGLRGVVKHARIRGIDKLLGSIVRHRRFLTCVHERSIGIHSIHVIRLSPVHRLMVDALDSIFLKVGALSSLFESVDSLRRLHSPIYHTTFGIV